MKLCQNLSLAAHQIVMSQSACLSNQVGWHSCPPQKLASARKQTNHYCKGITLILSAGDKTVDKDNGSVQAFACCQLGKPNLHWAYLAAGDALTFSCSIRSWLRHWQLIFEDFCTSGKVGPGKSEHKSNLLACTHQMTFFLIEFICEMAA